jgi:hypothetical protein
VAASKPGISAVATSYRLDCQGVSFYTQAKDLLSSLQLPQRLYGLLSLISNEKRERILRGVKRPNRESDHAFLLVTRLKIHVRIYPLSMCSHIFVLN